MLVNAAAERFVHVMPFGASLRDDGVAFRIWAPSRDGGAVVVDGAEHRLDRRGDGWFERFVPGARAGARYAFAFDGLDPRVPDPASRFQPDGVHGPSAVVDPTAYAWQHPGWRGRPAHELAFYEFHVGTFTAAGTYAAAAERLDDLAALGVTALELMPLAQPAGRRNWGYDGALPFAPQHAYGSPDELKAFVDAAHARGLSVFLDVVYNHFGPEGNYLGAFAGAFFTERHHTPWGSAIDVESDAAANVRAFFIHNALYWLHEYRFDGLRLDAVHEIRDASSPSFLVELASCVRSRAEPGRHVQLVLENDANDAGLLRSYDAQWNDDAHHAFHVLLTGEHDGYYGDYADDPVRRLARALAEGFAYQGEPSVHRGDAPRGEPSADLPATKFVDFLQNHDQIGNRAFGERLSMLTGETALRAASAVLLLAPALPLLFMGEEWAASTPFLFFSDFGAELGGAVTSGRRREFAAWPAFRDANVRERIPDPQDPATMEASRLRWDERSAPPHAAALAHHRALLALRARTIVPHLASGAWGAGYEVLDPATLVVRWRFGDGARLGVVARLGSATAPVSFAFEGAPLFTLGAVPPRLERGELAPWSVGWFLAP
ncbi:MAG: Malto-oligosyltrehalose trehalohydrolase [Candidatus Eremiobacteraeota bacterium]|jgi:maltooligosyltrehalose trehalohydrolase|nr:Malto-oligosyltrehalose trehalohydrolase [Candidatus Eremiobacteraeota bacterium]